MKTQRGIMGLLIFLVLICCKEKQSELLFENKVFYEVTPIIIDSLYQEIREIYPRLIQEFSTKNLNPVKKGNTPFIVVGILDSIQRLDKSDDSLFLKHFGNQNIHLDISKNDEKLMLDISRIKSSDIFNYKKLSQIPTEPDRWKKTEDFYLVGITSFSRIRFDSDRKYGFLKTSQHCGFQCAVYSRVYIKKIKEDWLIDKIESYMWE